MLSLRGVFPIIACLVLCFLFLNFSLLWLTGAAPRAYAPGEAYLDWKYFERAIDVGASLAAIYRSPHGAEKPLVLYTGMSTAIEGIDPGVLSTHSGCNSAVAGLCGTGGSMYALSLLQQSILSSKLRPDLLIICLHPQWLAAQFDRLPPDSLDPAADLRRRDWPAAARTIMWWNWLANNRFYVNQVVFKLLFETRIRLGTVGNTIPWTPPDRTGFVATMTAQRSQAQLIHFGQFGWFDIRHYAREQEAEAAGLRELISRYRARGTEVLVVIMPQGTAYRSRVPAEAKQFLLQYLHSQFHTSPVTVFDFESAIPDGEFADQIHLNQTGRVHFTLQLARAISAQRSARGTGCSPKADAAARAGYITALHVPPPDKLPDRPHPIILEKQ